jgi:Ca2+-binding EF-hand superfamily protein
MINEYWIECHLGEDQSLTQEEFIKILKNVGQQLPHFKVNEEMALMTNNHRQQINPHFNNKYYQDGIWNEWLLLYQKFSPLTGPFDRKEIVKIGKLFQRILSEHFQNDVDVYLTTTTNVNDI